MKSVANDATCGKSCCLSWDLWDCDWKFTFRLARHLPLENPKNPPQSQKSQFRRSLNFLSKGKEKREFLFSNRVLQHNCHPPANGVDEVDGFRFFEVGRRQNPFANLPALQ